MTPETQPTAQTAERNRRKVVQGRVLSAKMQKTIVVQAERLVRHPKYGKYMRRYSRFYAHDEKGEARLGDIVEIMESRPMSRLKRWRLIRVVERMDLPEEAMKSIEASSEVMSSVSNPTAEGKNPEAKTPAAKPRRS
ncbi:MAG: 30S ribosomal protein S17 [Planctomycetes bacterium]|nr:30S ribosomal protein S17 [Planctomycetota bacterium]